MRYIVILSGAILVLELMGLPLTQYLYFDRSLILQGQVWRVFTYIFLFGQSNIIFAAIALYFYYSLWSMNGVPSFLTSFILPAYCLESWVGFYSIFR